jgi:hypothetical protein
MTSVITHSCYCFDTDFWMLIVTTLILVVGWWQLRNFREEKRIEFGYKVYTNFFSFLDMDKNKDIKDWLFGKEPKINDWDRLGDLFEKFEVVYTFMKKNLIDDELFYDLFSFYIEKAFSAKNPSAQEYIEYARKKEEGKIGKTDDIFIGVERLYKKIKSGEPTRKEPDFK